MDKSGSGLAWLGHPCYFPPTRAASFHNSEHPRGSLCFMRCFTRVFRWVVHQPWGVGRADCPVSQVREQSSQEVSRLTQSPVAREGQGWKQGPWSFLLPMGPR